MTRQMTAIILAGGQSSRFGSDKAFVPWKGKPLIVHILDLLKPLFRVRLLVAKNTVGYQALGHYDAIFLEDASAGDYHPLNGILSGLAATLSSYNFICACDMPLLQSGLIEALCDASAGYDAVVPLWQGKPQPLCGVYSKNCLPAIRPMLDQKELGVTDVIGRVKTRYLAETEVARWDPQGLSFMDIDTKEDYRKASEFSP